MDSISWDIYNELIKNPLFWGYEGCLSVYGNDLMKLFRVFPIAGGYSEISDLYLNKRRKLEKILDKSSFSTYNLIYPKKLYSICNQFVSYTIPDRRDLKNLYSVKGFSINEKIEILKQYRKILDYFHCENIVFGDIKGQNILLSDDGKSMCFCDIDNVKVEDLPIDKLSRCAGYFCYDYGLVDYKLDSFMFNFLTLEYILDIYSPNFESVFDFLDDGVVPNFSANMDNNKIKQIFNEMNDIDSNYSGEYIIDYIK